jgi:hypothetical protein
MQMICGNLCFDIYNKENIIFKFENTKFLTNWLKCVYVYLQ